MPKKQDQPDGEQKKAKHKRRAHGEGSVTLRKDGRWQAQMMLENGKRKYFYAETKKEALDKLHEAQHKQKEGTLVTAPHQSVRDYMEHWLKAKRLELKEGTYTYYRLYTRKYIIPALGYRQLQKVTDAHIQSFYADLLEEEELSANTVRLIHAILSEAFNAAVRARKLSFNPCRTVTPPKAVKQELAYLTLEQAQKLLVAAKDHKLECLLTMAIATGMRLGELLALRWSDIDLQRKVVRVTRSLSYRDPDETGSQYREAEPKTASSKRSIPLPDFVLEALQKHRTQQLEQRLQAAQWVEKGLVFPNHKGEYLWAGPMRRQFQRLLEEVGLPSIRFHDLRHSAATILLGMGVNPKVVQERLGHSHISITLGIYGHVTESMQQDAVTKLDDQFRSPKEGQH